MPERQFRSFIRLCIATAIGLVLSTGLFSAQAQEREIKVGYMKNPIQDASLDIMEKWAKANNVKLTRVPMAYSVFMEKVTATLTSRRRPVRHHLAQRRLGPALEEMAGDDRRRQRHRERRPMAAARVLERRQEAHRRADGAYRRHVLLPHRPGQAGGGP